MIRLAIAGFSLFLVACGSDSPPEPVAVLEAENIVPDSAAASAPDAADTAATVSADVEILAQEFAYGATDARNFVGYFAAPAEIIEPLSGIVLVHEWWGLNDTIRALAGRLAAAGYAVLAVDLYNGSVASDAADAQSLMAAANADREGSVGNIGQAIDYLRAYALAPRVALLGYGLGGGIVLEATLAMPQKVDAVVTYYGRPVLNEDDLAGLRAPLLGFYGEHDDSIALRNVRAFRRTLQDLGKDSEVLIQIGAGHGFADPERPGFDAAITEESWIRTVAFLNRTIGAQER